MPIIVFPGASSGGGSNQSVLATYLGTGSDGVAVFDGINTFAFATLVGSVYTLTRAIYITSGIINASVTVDTARFAIYTTGILTNNGTIQSLSSSTAASGVTSGGWAGVARLTGQSGGNGGTTTTGAAGSGSNNTLGGSGGSGGLIGAIAGGAGGSGTVFNQFGQVNPFLVSPENLPMYATACAVNTLPSGGGGGGGGASVDASHRGGGGGFGGPVIVLNASSVINTGTINASGGAGAASPSSTNGGGGGGGAGGWIIVNTITPWTNSGTTNVTGGSGGAGVGTGTAGVAGASGTVTNNVWG